LVHLDDLSGFTVFVKQDGEGHLFILDEGSCVSSASGAQCCDARPGFQDLFVPLTDLTGPFPTRQSAEVAQEEQYMAIIGPQVTEAVRGALGIGQCQFCEAGDRVHLRGA
jgi:hypothetical protein